VRIFPDPAARVAVAVRLVRVNGSSAFLSPEEFAYDYPRGLIVRIRYVEDWPQTEA
jgi:hypothetical protein